MSITSSTKLAFPYSNLIEQEMISRIKPKRYQRKRLFREDDETTAVSIQCIDVSSDIMQQSIDIFISTNRRNMNQMVRSFPDDRETRIMQANTEEYSSYTRTLVLLIIGRIPAKKTFS